MWPFSPRVNPAEHTEHTEAPAVIDPVIDPVEPVAVVEELAAANHDNPIAPETAATDTGVSA